MLRPVLGPDSRFGLTVYALNRPLTGLRTKVLRPLAHICACHKLPYASGVSEPLSAWLDADLEFQFLHMPGVISPGIVHSGGSNPQHPQRSASSKTNAFSPVDHSGVTRGLRYPQVPEIGFEPTTFWT